MKLEGLGCNKSTRGDRLGNDELVMQIGFNALFLGFLACSEFPAMVAVGRINT